MVHAARRDLEAAAREAEASGGIAGGPDWSALAAAGIPVIDVLTVARHVLEGRIAQARGDLSAARTAFDEAVAIQDRLAYAEPPHCVLSGAPVARCRFALHGGSGWRRGGIPSQPARCAQQRLGAPWPGGDVPAPGPARPS
ncbi:MAG: hypothetical protein M3461_12980 [Pseudomonadota bacterium]|nr:hypothetical protein [Pseudomonadota bacterium]